MKKILTLLLAVMMIASMSVTAFAAETSTGGDTSITVKGTYGAGSSGDVVSVGIAWGAMEFTYKDAGTYWDASSHTTKTSSEAGWTASGNDITVTNHSNVGITASFSFSSSTQVTVGGKFYDAAADGNEITSLDLDRAAEGSDLDSQQASAYFVITDGTIDQNYDNLGTITVNIAKAAN